MTNDEINERRNVFMKGLAQWSVKNGYTLLAAAGDIHDDRGNFSFCLRNAADKTDISDITTNLSNAVEAAYVTLTGQGGVSGDVAKNLIRYFVESGIERGENAIGRDYDLD